VPGQAITDGQWGYGWGANSGLAAGSLTEAALQAELASEIDQFTSGGIAPTFPTQPAPTAAPDNALWVIWLPPDVSTPTLSGAFGYHNFFTHTGKRVTYAVIGFLDSWKGFQDTMFVTETHEIYEAVTDPYITTGWRDTTGNEIGDVCGRAVLDTAAITAWNTPAGPISVQKEWSIKKCDCVDINQYGGQLTTPLGSTESLQLAQLSHRVSSLEAEIVAARAFMQAGGGSNLTPAPAHVNETKRNNMKPE
jgi:hypothetical protein